MYVRSRLSLETLVNNTGFGWSAAKLALDVCEGDTLLAEGWLTYQGCAVKIRKEGMSDEDAYQDWVWSQAHAFKARKLLEMESHQATKPS